MSDQPLFPLIQQPIAAELPLQQPPPENTGICGIGVCAVIELITSNMDRFVQEQPIIALVCAIFFTVFALSQIIPFGSIIIGIPLLYFAYCVFSRIWANPAQFAQNFNAAAAQQGAKNAIAPQQPQVPLNAFQSPPTFAYTPIDPSLLQLPTLPSLDLPSSFTSASSAAATTSSSAAPKTATTATTAASTATTATPAKSDASTPSKKTTDKLSRSATLPRPPAKGTTSETPEKKAT